jgi:2-methylisocitrate lyase-like PEP mutase family enzyme
MTEPTLDREAQQQKAQAFAALHVKGQPVILYNIWDAGSAQAVASVGAKAIASGSHGVANANGYEDGEEFPLEVAIENAKRIVASTSLPVTMDIETGYGATTEEVRASVAQVITTGVVGVNIEDQIFGQKELRPADEQVDRLKATRAAADEAGLPLWINARTDIFKNTDPAQHADVLAEALARAQAYAAAGANSFFVPGLADINLIKQLVEQSPLPVNIIRLAGVPETSELAAVGVARISYGPVPYLEMIEWLKEKAAAAIS